MNFFGRLSNALESVGEVMAPLPHEEEDDSGGQRQEEDAGGNSNSRNGREEQQEREEAAVVEEEEGIEMQRPDIEPQHNEDISRSGEEEEEEEEVVHNDENGMLIDEGEEKERSCGNSPSISDKIDHSRERFDRNISNDSHNCSSTQQCKDNNDNNIVRGEELDSMVELQRELENLSKAKRVLEEECVDKNRIIQQLSTEFSAEKKRRASAFSEVESLSNDLRSTLQQITSLKIELDKESSSRKQLESKCEELRNSFNNQNECSERHISVFSLIEVLRNAGVAEISELADKLHNMYSTQSPEGSEIMGILLASFEELILQKSKTKEDCDLLKAELSKHQHQLDMIIEEKKELENNANDNLRKFNDQCALNEHIENSRIQLEKELVEWKKKAEYFEKEAAKDYSSPDHSDGRILALERSIKCLEEKNKMLESNDFTYEISSLKEENERLRKEALNLQENVSQLQEGAESRSLHSASNGQENASHSKGDKQHFAQMKLEYERELLEYQRREEQNDKEQREMRRGFEEKLAFLEGENKKLSKHVFTLEEEKGQLAQKVSSLQATSESSQCAASQDVISMKQKNQKLETEVRQLHQVISQLRQARRSNQENVESAKADRESQNAIIERQNQELSDLRGYKAKFMSSEEKNESLTRELNHLRSDYHASESSATSRISTLESDVAGLRQQLATCEAEKYDVEARLEAARSDVMIARHDLSLRSQELENLHAAISSMEKEHEGRMRAARLDQQGKLEALEEEWTRKLEGEKEFYLQDVEFYKQRVEEWEERVQDERLLRRKMEIEMSAEKSNMHNTLKEALDKLQHSQEDTVDRTLVKNLVVTYIRQKRSKEILSLISRILGFTDEDRVEVGLQVSEGSIVTSLFQNLWSPLSSNMAAPKRTELTGDNLAELWQNFLIQESGGALEGDASADEARVVSSGPGNNITSSNNKLENSHDRESNRDYQLRGFSSIVNQLKNPQAATRRGIQPGAIMIPSAGSSPTSSSRSSPPESPHDTNFKLVSDSPVFSPSRTVKN